ncbi:MAG: MATE family efflux transporter, partial [Angelakisella sp.]
FLVSALGWVLSFTLPNALRAAGDVRFTMTASVLSMWIFRVGASYLMVLWFQMGVYGVWYGMFIDWAVRILCFVWRFASGKWKNRAVI